MAQDPTKTAPEPVWTINALFNSVINQQKIEEPILQIIGVRSPNANERGCYKLALSDTNHYMYGYLDSKLSICKCRRV